jgi:hypothetical protein
MASKLMTEEQVERALYIVARDMMPSVLREMLNQDLINPDERLNREYLWDVVHSNKEVLEAVKVTTQIHDGFIEIVEYAISSDNPQVAVVLLATVVEHLLNLYYGERLTIQGLSKKDVTQIIRAHSIDAKTGWLIPLTGQFEFPDELRKRLLKLAELRNCIVHYKGLPSKLDEEDSYRTIKAEIERIDFNELLASVSELESLLESVLDSVDPNRRLAREMAGIMFEGLDEKYLNPA